MQISSYLEVAPWASVVDQSAHAEGTEGDFDQVIASYPFAVWQVEEAVLVLSGIGHGRAAAVVLETHFGPQGHVAAWFRSISHFRSTKTIFVR